MTSYSLAPARNQPWPALLALLGRLPDPPSRAKNLARYSISAPLTPLAPLGPMTPLVGNSSRRNRNSSSSVVRRPVGRDQRLARLAMRTGARDGLPVELRTR